MADRIAVLVDGDNVSAVHSEQVLAEAARLGRVDVARVYAAANTNSAWLITPGYLAMHAGVGKNAADILLCIDAMELALTGGLETFVIASSDGDFTHLAQRLRERGQHVLGLGEAKATKAFRMACTQFITLKTPQCGAAAPAVKPPALVAKPSPPKLSELDRNIKVLIATHSKQGRVMAIEELGRNMYTIHGAQMKNRPEGTWRAYLDERPNLYDIDPRGPEAFVRFRPKAFASA
ncbi:MAG: NYN domain-containing protein [Roseovarius sp.]|nr:NYN domain-containing protein [Roseovarius sp.]